MGGGQVLRIFINKAGYTAIQLRTVRQEQYFENRSEFKNVTDRLTDILTDLPTDTARCRVACPRLKMREVKMAERFDVE